MWWVFLLKRTKKPKRLTFFWWLETEGLRLWFGFGGVETGFGGLKRFHFGGKEGNLGKEGRFLLGVVSGDFMASFG